MNASDQLGFNVTLILVLIPSLFHKNSYQFVSSCTVWKTKGKTRKMPLITGCALNYITDILVKGKSKLSFLLNWELYKA